MANRATEPEPQGQSESYLVADDAGDTARLLDHFAHPVERFHVEGNEDSVSGAQPHIVPSCNRRLCESAINKPAAFVRPRKVGTYAHDHLRALPRWSQHTCRSPMTRLVTGMRRMAVVVLQLSPKGAAEHWPRDTSCSRIRKARRFRSRGVASAASAMVRTSPAVLRQAFHQLLKCKPM
jgi:hypothetical protein